MSAPTLSTGRQPRSGECAQRPDNKKNKMKRNSNSHVLCPTCHIFPNTARKRTTELQMGLKVPGLREEEVASKADTGFVIQVHIPLVAACGRTLWAFLD